jgi:hypothetical protein
MTTTRPTYFDFVKALFKPLPTIGEVAHHATTGVSGEVGELAEADSRKNIFEECGDLEFYLEALFQAIGKTIPDTSFTSYIFLFGELIPRMHTAAARLLDLTKKSWIYQRDLPVDLIYTEALSFIFMLDSFYLFIGTTREEIQGLNIDKLLVRYEGMVYSDEAARNRADKA